MPNLNENLILFISTFTPLCYLKLVTLQLLLIIASCDKTRNSKYGTAELYEAGMEHIPERTVQNNAKTSAGQAGPGRENAMEDAKSTQ